jgi:hypothetical protein
MFELWRRKQNEAMFEPALGGKVAFTTAPASLHDLDDDDSAMNGVFEPVQKKRSTFFAPPPEFASPFAGSSLAGVVIPAEEVPDAHEVEYLQVNPSFESRESASTVFETLQRSLKTRGIEFNCNQDWSVRTDICLGTLPRHLLLSF